MVDNGGGQDSRALAFRVPLAAVLYVLASSWMVRHSGWSLERIPLVGAVIATASGLYGYLGSEAKGGWPERWRSTLRFLVSSPALATLALIFVLVSAFVSSVQVSGGRSGQTVGLRPGEAPGPVSRWKRFGGEGRPVRFVAWTAAFGRAYTLSAPGYNAHSFELRPWIGEVVDLNRDLTPSPALLFRVPDRQFPLLSGGRFEVLLPRGRSQVATQPEHASILVGRRVQPGRALRDDWLSELKALGRNEQQQEFTIRGWSSPLAPDSTEFLSPGDSVEVRFVARSGDVASRCRCEVGGEPMQDLLLTEVSP